MIAISSSSSLPRQRSRQHLAHMRSASMGNDALDAMVAIDMPEHVSILISPSDDQPPDPF
eukprot:1438961-Pyramimonas_sp.AAC.1